MSDNFAGPSNNLRFAPTITFEVIIPLYAHRRKVEHHMQNLITLANHPKFRAGYFPSILDKIIPRGVSHIPDDYLEWAEAFALLKEEVIISYAGRVPRLGVSASLNRRWQPARHAENCYHVLLGDVGDRDCGELWVDQYDEGWVIELMYPCRPPTENRGRVLTYSYLVQWPVLCPSLELAARLAVACFPEPDRRTQLWWHSYS